MTKNKKIMGHKPIKFLSKVARAMEKPPKARTSS
jgi:hypothetical protein